MTVAALLLAAGQSLRFGADDKLMARLQGRPLVAHAAQALIRPGIGIRLAVVTAPPIEAVLCQMGFRTLMLPAGLPQSGSLAAGMGALAGLGATRAVIALGDMPFLCPEDIDRLLDMPAASPACADDRGVPMPPAVFPQSWFARLTTLRGDRGAGALLRDLPAVGRVLIPADRLRDVDIPGDLIAP